MTTAGMAMREESKRSSIPPCPGIMLPESLMPSRRFRSDSTRSPHVPKMTTTSAKPPQTSRDWTPCSPAQKGMNVAIICDAAMATSAPPILPSHDFFGDTRGKRRCLPSRLPKQYAPVSLDQRKMNRASGYQ